MIPVKLIAGFVIVAAVAGGILYTYNTGKSAGYSQAITEFSSSKLQAGTLISKARARLLQEQRDRFNKAIKKSQRESQDHLIALRKQEDINDNLRKIKSKPVEVLKIYAECKFTEDDYLHMLNLYSTLREDTDEGSEERI